MSNYKLFTKHDQEIRKIVNKMDSVLYYDRVCEELFSDKITLGIIVVWHKLSIIMKEQILTNDDEKISFTPNGLFFFTTNVLNIEKT